MKRFISLLLLLLPAAAAAQPPVAPEQAPESKAAPAPAEALRAPRPDTVALPMHDHTGLVGECPYRHAFTEPRSVVPLTPCGNAYAECRRMLSEDKLPAAGDVHIDQLVNHFTYDYPAPARPLRHPPPRRRRHDPATAPSCTAARGVQPRTGRSLPSGG